jgi:hypothetical protein
MDKCKKEIKWKGKNDYLEEGVCSTVKIRACALFQVTNSIAPSDLRSHFIQTIKEPQQKKNVQLLHFTVNGIFPKISNPTSACSLSFTFPTRASIIRS